jgi:hypothetical protein
MRHSVAAGRRIVLRVARRPLTYNPSNGVTAGMWSEDGVVHKILTRRRDAPPHWAASDDERHWNFWRREALAYESGLPAQLGLGAPRVLGIAEVDDGDVELRLEHVEGRHSDALTVEDLEVVATALGRAQGRREIPAYGWLSQGFLRAYGGARPVNWALLADHDAWAQPPMRDHFPARLRQGLVRLHDQRERLLDLMERLPRTLCHLDVWPNNLIRRPDGEVVLLDWAFAGDGALGEDIGNLIPNVLLPPEALDDLDARLTAAYLQGLREAEWTGDERLVRLAICASAVRYDFLTAYCLEHASAGEHLDYAEHAAALALCARWAEEAERLAR